MKNVAAYAVHKYARISPRKVKPVMDLVRGKSLYDAKVTLAVDETKAAKMLFRVLKSAESNAKNAKVDTKNLFLDELWVGDGVRYKRGRASGRGRYSLIIKRLSNIYVGLKERTKK